MRTLFFGTMTDPVAIATILRRRLSLNEINVSPEDSQELAAAVLGWPSWDAMVEPTGGDVDVRSDDSLTPSEYTGRRSDRISALVRHEIPTEIAAAVVDAVMRENLSHEERARALDLMTSISPDALAPGWQAKLGERLHPMWIEALENATLTADGEPDLMGPEEWPENYSVHFASETVAFKPHPSLWARMPTELAWVRVHYKDGGEERNGVPLVKHLTFGFANGSELELPGEHLLGGPLFDKVPSTWFTDDLSPILVNPFTSRMSMYRMRNVLKVHSILLFCGSDREELVWPEGAEARRMRDSIRLVR